MPGLYDVTVVAMGKVLCRRDEAVAITDQDSDGDDNDSSPDDELVFSSSADENSNANLVEDEESEDEPEEVRGRDDLACQPMRSIEEARLLTTSSGHATTTKFLDEPLSKPMENFHRGLSLCSSPSSTSHRPGRS